ncbi:cytochrome c maturation protein CcmE [Thalassolituus pacificus]|jgi:cytochrome c-type biogenesis protein CcmE|uniref:Cytochrome c-type biogenesis protein CcmE n=1 Tax=Thalassolituus pacificus TaxID=2975440 RepID=A0A9X2WCL5_9GAMM|nr:cytochrome c maturation protein CcmE [Thalassolituus pacificus]MCT7357954.1 cytochrome c maturation protein CcmE [Thalassolituus pacificus]
MHPKRKKRLTLILFMVLGVSTAVGLLMYSLSQNINLFMTPTQIASGEAPVGRTIRAGGLVEPGTVERDDSGLGVRFVVTDGRSEVTIAYEGILPDLFREGQGIVAMGQLGEDGVFVASEVLAKHDENYMPPEVQDALDQAHKDGKQALEEARY